MAKSWTERALFQFVRFLLWWYLWRRWGRWGEKKEKRISTGHLASCALIFLFRLLAAFLPFWWWWWRWATEKEHSNGQRVQSENSGPEKGQNPKSFRLLLWHKVNNDKYGISLMKTFVFLVSGESNSNQKGGKLSRKCPEQMMKWAKTKLTSTEPKFNYGRRPVVKVFATI